MFQKHFCGVPISLLHSGNIMYLYSKFIYQKIILFALQYWFFESRHRPLRFLRERLYITNATEVVPRPKAAEPSSAAAPPIFNGHKELSAVANVKQCDEYAERSGRVTRLALKLRWAMIRVAVRWKAVRSSTTAVRGSPMRLPDRWRRRVLFWSTR